MGMNCINPRRSVTCRFSSGGGMVEQRNVDAAKNFSKPFSPLVLWRYRAAKRAPKNDLRNSWQRPHDERYDNGELAMLTLLWEYWVIHDQSSNHSTVFVSRDTS